MGIDHLDTETSVSAELTRTGVTAKAKSRAIAAFDRLVGNFFDRWTVPREIETAEMRALARGRLSMIEAAAKAAVKRIDMDPAYAEEVLGASMGQLARRHENKRGVLEATMTDLQNDPPDERQSAVGDDVLSEEFVARFERHAEDAGTQALREKWAKVLAAEIREPGSVGARSMRVIDELDTDTGALFERVCKNRVPGGIPKMPFGELTFSERTSLIEAGLIVDPGISGHLTFLTEIKNSSTSFLCALSDGKRGCMFSYEGAARVLREGPLTVHKGKFGLSLYLFTEVGRSIARIFPDNGENTMSELGRAIAEQMAPTQVLLIRVNSEGNVEGVRPIVVSNPEASNAAPKGDEGQHSST